MRSRRADGTTTTMMMMGRTWASTARARGPAKEHEGVYGVGEAGQHAMQRAQEDGKRTRRYRCSGYLDTIYLLCESPSGNLSRDAGYLRIPS